MIAALLLSADDVHERIESLLQSPHLQGAIVGVHIETVHGDTLYSRNADTRLMPASNQKIVSVYYALATLGPDHRPETRFWKQGDDIVVHAQGDPLLTEALLKEARQRLGATPNTRILVKQDFAPGFGFGWEHDDLPHAYASKITALTIDGGRFVVRVQDHRPLAPSYAGVALNYRPSPGNPRLTYDRERSLLTVQGTMPASSNSLERFALPSPPRAAANILGGQFFQTETLPDRAPDHVIQGRPVSELAKLCLEPSDNAIAEHLLLLAAAKQGPLGSNEFSTACQRMSEFYQNTVKLPPGTLRAVDGSGLSRHNLVTPRALAHILRHVHSTEHREMFYEALPAPGEGTLRQRLAGLPVFAKTGTLSGASALSGYVITNNGPITFSIVMNHFVAPAANMRSLQDDIVRELLSTKTVQSYGYSANRQAGNDPVAKALPDQSPLPPAVHWLY